MRAIFWDLDDTVLDTLAARMDALAHAHEVSLGTSVDPRELWKAHAGGTLEDLGRKLVGDDYAKFSQLYRDHYYASSTEIRAFDGIPEVLRDLAAHGLKHAIVTSKVSWGATEELEKLGLLQYFEAVIGFDDTEAHKPDPAPVYAAMERVLIDDPRDILFIGDAPTDVGVANRSGCVSVAATWGTLDRERLLAERPNHVAESPQDVAMIVSRLLELDASSKGSDE